MKERPILFSGPMVRAILAGRKTQTRRAIKKQRPEWAHFGAETDTEGREFFVVCGERDGTGMSPIIGSVSCPYGAPGDRLWVRETGWQRPERTPQMMREGADTWIRYYYDADGLIEQDHADFKAWGFKRRPSIFMPRWASRIALEITGVRVERLQDISTNDAIAEGAELAKPGLFAIPAYRTVWESINGVGSWDGNPWVWVIEFKRTEAPR